MTTVTKNLDWFPSFANQIDIDDGCFTVCVTKEKIDIDCIWDYGYAGRGSEHMSFSVNFLKGLIAEIEQSESTNTP